MDIAVLTNPAAGGGLEAGLVDRVLDQIKAAGHGLELLEPTDSAAARDSAADAVGGSDRVIVVGGDGLVHLATQAAAGTKTPLGIIAAGTGNDTARGFGLPLDDTRRATEAALAAAVPVDAIWTSHGWGVSVATLGFSGAVTDRANQLRWPRGSNRYTAATLMELPRLRPLHVAVEVDAVKHELSTTLLALGNTRWFGGGMEICPDASPTDGQLDLTIIGPVGRFKFAQVFPQVFGGKHVRHPQVATDRGRQVRIGALTNTDQKLWADGELLGSLPVDIEIRPGALHIAGAQVKQP